MTGINLIPKSLRMAQARQHRITRWVISGVVVGIALAIAVGLDWLNLAEADDLRARSARLQADLQRAHADQMTLAAEVNQVRLQVERANALRAKRAWSGVIGLVGACLPERCWLESLTTDPSRPKDVAVRSAGRGGKTDAKEPPPRAVTIDAPRKLRIVGYGPEAALPHALVSKLKEAQVFTDVELVSAQRTLVLDGSYYRFELVCEW